MPRRREMSWVKSQKLWRKWAFDPTVGKSRWFTVSPRQLRIKYGCTLEECPDGKEGSWVLANRWWQEKEIELATAGKPSPRPLTNQEQIAFANAGIPPEEWEQQARELDKRGTISKVVNASLSMLVRQLVKQGTLSSEVASLITDAQAQRLENAGRALRLEESHAPDNSLARLAQRWLDLQADRVRAGGKTARAAELHRLQLSYFITFMDEQTGGSATVADINEER